ncbi:ROK family transcriptional regulator [Candidatus Aerophobetes bacterium]|nr:ROK family transcriptional regulator [Candidatus Aerophobetes bacterium]
MKTSKKIVARPESMGRLNQSLVLDQIRINGPTSRAEIARETGLSKPSVSRAVDILLRKKLILRENFPKDQGKIGRKPEILKFNVKAAYFGSVDIGGTKITFGLGSLSEELLKKCHIRNPHNWDKIIKIIPEQIKKILKDTNIPQKKLKGIAIAAQGVVDIDKGTVSSSPNINGPERYPLREKLRKNLPVSIWIENDVNLAAIGEFWKEEEKYRNIVYISLGTAIGGAIIINGKLFRGANYYAGEVGWFVPGKDYLFKNFGKFGCLEGLATGPALIKKAKEMVQRESFKEDIFSPLTNEITPKKLFEAYKKDSKLAKNVVKEWIENLGITISNISSLLNPELIILEGGLTRSGGFFLDDLKRIVEWGTQIPPEIKISTLQGEAPLYGGLKLCTDNYMKELSAGIKN